MRRSLVPFLVMASGLVLLLWVYRPVLFHGEQFGFRDTAHFYYPLYYRIQQEWRAGRLPLWDPWQNGGQPLLGNPLAAVLYPGKLIYVPVSYAWGARLYVIAHTVLALAGMVALARSLGVSWVGSGISGLSYAFGGPVLFQYGNLIYLVGAAWLPWGLRAVERLLRLQRPGPLVVLALILAMQVYGGDPQAAYLTVVAGAALAVMPALRGRGLGAIWGAAVAALAGVLWVVGVLTLAWWRPPLSSSGWLGAIWLPAVMAWAAAAAWALRQWRRGVDGGIGRRLALLAGAGALGLALAAAPLFTALEYMAVGNRTGARLPTNRTKFSVEPYRLAELVWPWAFGHPYAEHHGWIQLIPPEADRELWVPSLYAGGLALVLGLAAAGLRGAPWRGWLTVVGALGLAASFGKFAGPLWWLRWWGPFAAALGPHDPILSGPRTDAFALDALGCPYDLLAAWLPGFGLFRYPAKLFTLTAVAGAALAGLGWDELMAGRSRRAARGFVVMLAASALALGLAVAVHDRLVDQLSRRSPILIDSGPLDAAAAWFETERALAHGLVVAAVGLALAVWGPRRPGWAGAAALAAMAIDLGVTNSRMVWTVPQADFDAPPEVARRIAEAERLDPAPWPFRIHRMSAWHPDRFLQPSSPARARELYRWYHDTLNPLEALALGLEYGRVEGVINRDEYLAFFAPRLVPAEAAAARALKVRPGQSINYFPRRGFDLWGVRYFILPVRTLGWRTEDRGFASFLPRSEVIYPPRSQMEGRESFKRWTRDQDWQLLRNKSAYPRAWLVHAAQAVPPASDAEAHDLLMRALLYQDDMFWSDPGLPVYDPRSLVWIEANAREALRGYLARGERAAPVEPGESVTIARTEATRVELRVRLKRPGIVVLADAYYPGWHLAIDGRPAPIFRANRMMRGAAVRAGEHTLVYTYDPLSFRIGAGVTLISLAAAALLLAGPRLRKFRHR